MNTAFAENIGLMQELNFSFNVDKAFKNTAYEYTTCLRTATTEYETGTIANLK